MTKIVGVFDLDYTVFIAETLQDKIFKGAHQLGPIISIEHKFNDRSASVNVRIINPSELTKLIEHCCTKHDGLMFITSGRWSARSIKSLLIDHLNLSSETKQKIEQAVFMNPESDQKYFPGESKAAIAEKPKVERLTAFLQANPELHGNVHLVVIDDGYELHIKPINEHPDMTGIHATTHKTDVKYYRKENPSFNPMEFYQRAIDVMDKLRASSTATIMQGLNAPACSNSEHPKYAVPPVILDILTKTHWDSDDVVEDLKNAISAPNYVEADDEEPQEIRNLKI